MKLQTDFYSVFRETVTEKVKKPTILPLPLSSVKQPLNVLTRQKLLKLAVAVSLWKATRDICDSSWQRFFPFSAVSCVS